MIKATNLDKYFGEIHAVRNLSLEVPDGKITGLLGPNGSGKSTTMRMICGVLQPDVGSVEIDGHNVTTSPELAKARLGVVPDARGLYTRLTARENLAYYGKLQGLHKTTINTRIAELAEELGMADLLDRKTEGFSQGQRVKVAIGRAMIANPQNLLLDEPSNGLDVMSTRALREYLIAQRAAGRAVLLSTHVMQEVTALCDHILIVANGQLKAQGSADELLSMTGHSSLEDAFVELIGTDEGLMS